MQAALARRVVARLQPVAARGERFRCFSWLSPQKESLTGGQQAAARSQASPASARSQVLPGAPEQASQPRQQNKKVPPETSDEVTRKLKAQKDYWLDQDHPLHRRILSQWGGLIWFGSFCVFSWCGKKWGEMQMEGIEKEMSKPRRHREKYVEETAPA
mmetsp:Transcript_84771/g.152760  ORF Transcript_84771/g.152760 Transcript_84771/m.152760 type:complete len:158 (-) Transcript_84771:84-557(-)